MENILVAQVKKSYHFLICAFCASSFIFFLLWGALAYTPLGVWFVESQSVATPFAQLPEKADAIVILGGQSMRGVDAAKLYYAGKSERIIVSADEDAMLDVLFGVKIPRERIVIDPEPKRTADHPRTILSVPGITKQSRLIIASDQMQERRAARLFRDAGYENFWIYSQWAELRVPQIKARGYIGPVEAARCMWRALAWVKYWFVD